MDGEAIDHYIGYRLKERRKQLRLSQTALSDMVGVSYQQIQKYENGSNKLTASRLLQLGQALNVPISYFYEGVDTDWESINKRRENQTVQRERKNPLFMLLIEDNAADAIIIRELIRQCEPEVRLEIIDDSMRVIPWLEDQERLKTCRLPDLVLLDLSLPGRNGFDLLEQLKEHESFRAIPTVGLTGSVSRRDMERVYKLGGSGYLLKSIEEDEFKRRLSLLVNYWAQAMILPHM